MQKSSVPIVKHISNFLDFVDVEKGLSHKTQENYSRFLDRFKRWLADNKLTGILPHQLTTDLIWQYRVFLSRHAISQKTKKTLSKKTQNLYLIALRSLLQYFSKRDIVALPSDKIELAKQDKTRTIHFLNLEKVEALLTAPDISDIAGLRDRAMLETLFSTGLRVAELARLDRDEINVKGLPSILELVVTGKGGKTRTVYISARCLNWLKRYLEKRHDVEKALFINYSTKKGDTDSKRLTTRSIERILKRYVMKAGLPVNTTPHTLRHSFATDLMNNGVDIRLVQEFLGHEDISTTQIYTHVTNNKLRDVYLKSHGEPDAGR